MLEYEKALSLCRHPQCDLERKYLIPRVHSGQACLEAWPIIKVILLSLFL